MQDKTKQNLIAPEVSGLWTTYMAESLVVCVLKYFLNRVEDEEIPQLLQHSLNISNEHIKFITDRLNQEGLPIPKGFNDNDVDINAPRLFNDLFYLYYLLNMAQYGMVSSAYILGYIARPDIRDTIFSYNI